MLITGPADLLNDPVLQQNSHAGARQQGQRGRVFEFRHLARPTPGGQSAAMGLSAEAELGRPSLLLQITGQGIRSLQ